MNVKSPTLRLFLYAMSMAALVATSSCHTEKKQEPEADKAFVLNDSIMKIITIDTVKNRFLEGNLELNGEVTFNDNKVVRVMPIVTGTVQSVNVQLGDYVTQGQVLATIRSGELASLQSDLASSSANLKVANKNLEVAKDLEQKGINSQKEVLEAQQEYYKAEAEVNQAKSKLALIGGNISGNEVFVKSPVSGYIVERKVNPNQVVDGIDGNSAEAMFTVSDLKQVWVMANVYEADIEKVKQGEAVTITTIAYPDKVFKGTIAYVSNMLDPDNKTMKVRVVLDNPGNELKPEMFAKVILDYKQKLEVPSIPHDAVVFEDSKNFVVVYQGKDKLSVKQVELYPTHDDVLYIRSGLKAGDLIISKNQLIIYNALTSL